MLRAKSAVTKFKREPGNYTTMTFNDLLQRQMCTNRKNSIAQLQEDGVGYICLQHLDLHFPTAVRNNCATLLSKTRT